jgi:hypothetical protein
MPLRRSILAGVTTQTPRRPQFVRTAEVLRLPASQRHQPGLGFERDRRLPARARAVIERSPRAFNHGALDAALDDLMMQAERPTDRKKRGTAIFARVRPGLPAPFASARSISASPCPLLQAPIQSPAAMTPPPTYMGIRQAEMNSSRIDHLMRHGGSPGETVVEIHQ